MIPEDQTGGELAFDAAGNFVIVWTGRFQDGSNDGVFGQRYASTGAPRGGEFRVNTYTTGNQRGPSVGMDGAGNFVVVWTHYFGTYPDFFGDVMVQRFGSSGAPLGTEFRANTYTTGLHEFLNVAMAANGRFVVVWESNAYRSNQRQDKSKGGAFGQLFDSTGAPVGPEFRANSYTTDEQQAPRAGVDAAGNFVVVWTSYGGQDGYERGIFGQRYTSDGIPRGGEFLVNAVTTGRQDGAAVAMNAAGDFVVVWQTAPDLSYLDIVARRFGADGTPFGTEIPVNSYTFRVQDKPAVALDAGGRFVVAWQSRYRDGSEESIQAQRFCPSLSAVTITTSGFTSVCPGGTGGTATATDSYGGPSTHQWQYRPTGGMAYTDIPGATGSTYVIQANDFAGGAFGTYDLVCTTSPQCGSAITSGPVTITIATDGTPPSVAPPAAATATQTLCQ